MAYDPAANALAARSVALNQRYGLNPAWTALAARSVAQNLAKYGTRQTINLPAPGGAAKTTATTTATKPRGGTTPRPKTMAEMAAEIAALSINPQISSVQRAADSAALAGRQAAEAWAKMTAGDASAVQDAYQSAASRVAGYAHDLSGGAASSQQAVADAVNAEIARRGQTSGITSDAAANAATLETLGGFLPAQSLEQQAAAAVAGETGSRLAGGKTLLDQGAAAQAKAIQSIADIEAKRPEAVYTALDSLQKQKLAEAESARQQRALEVQIGTLNLNRAKTQWDTAQALTDTTGSMWLVDKNGKVYNSGRVATGSDSYIAAKKAQQAANTQAQKTRLANRKLVQDQKQWSQRLDIYQQGADTADRRAAAQEEANRIREWKNKHPQQKPSKTTDPRQVQATFRKNAADMVRKTLGDYRASSPFKPPLAREQIVKAIYNTYGSFLAGQFPGWNEHEIKTWAYQVLNGIAPKTWWTKKQSRAAPKAATGGGVSA